MMTGELHISSVTLEHERDQSVAEEQRGPRLWEPNQYNVNTL